MHILVVNGPNMNMLGIRQPEIYGHETYEDLKALIRAEADRLGASVSFFQSNHEGALVDAIQQAYFDHVDGIIINPAAYTHTSVALLYRHPGRYRRNPDPLHRGPSFQHPQPGGVPPCLLHPGRLRGHHPGPWAPGICGGPAVSLRRGRLTNGGL